MSNSPRAALVLVAAAAISTLAAAASGGTAGPTLAITHPSSWEVAAGLLALGSFLFMIRGLASRVEAVMNNMGSTVDRPAWRRPSASIWEQSSAADARTADARTADARTADARTAEARNGDQGGEWDRLH